MLPEMCETKYFVLDSGKAVENMWNANERRSQWVCIDETQIDLWFGKLPFQM